jgi:hypothetical protein
MPPIDRAFGQTKLIHLVFRKLGGFRIFDPRTMNLVFKNGAKDLF